MIPVGHFHTLSPVKYSKGGYSTFLSGLNHDQINPVSSISDRHRTSQTPRAHHVLPPPPPIPYSLHMEAGGRLNHEATTRTLSLKWPTVQASCARSKHSTAPSPGRDPPHESRAGAASAAVDSCWRGSWLNFRAHKTHHNMPELGLFACNHYFICCDSSKYKNQVQPRLDAGRSRGSGRSPSPAIRLVEDGRT